VHPQWLVREEGVGDRPWVGQDVATFKGRAVQLGFAADRRGGRADSFGESAAQFHGVRVGDIGRPAWSGGAGSIAGSKKILNAGDLTCEVAAGRIDRKIAPT
jgi:hypothetical protein